MIEFHTTISSADNISSSLSSSLSSSSSSSSQLLLNPQLTKYNSLHFSCRSPWKWVFNISSNLNSISKTIPIECKSINDLPHRKLREILHREKEDNDKNNGNNNNNSNNNNNNATTNNNNNSNSNNNNYYYNNNYNNIRKAAAVRSK